MAEAETRSTGDANHAVAYGRYFDRVLRERLKKLVTDEVIAEHRTNPLGFAGCQSPALMELLNYFRRAPPAGKYIVVALVPWTDYRLGVLSGVRGVPPKVLDEPRFTTENDALHGVFLARVRDLMAS